MAEWVRGKLSLKLTAIITGVIILSVGCINLVLYQRSILSLEREAYGRLEEMVRAYGNELDIEITSTMQIADTLSALIREDFSFEKIQTQPGYLEHQIERLDPYVKVIAQEFGLAKTAYVYYNWELDGNVHDIYYVDTDNDGTVTRQTPLTADYFSEDFSERGSKAWWFGPIQTRKGYWSAPYPWVFDDGTETVFLSYTRAVYVDGRFVGVTGTDFKYEDLTKRMKEINVYETGYPFLLDGDNGFLIHPTQGGKTLEALRPEPFKTLREEIPFKTEGAFRYTEADGKPWFITYRRLRNNWILGLAAPVSEVTHSAGALTAMVLGIMAVSVPLIGLAAFLTARHVTVPLRALTESAQRMHSGDHTHPVSPQILKRNDEVGKLGQAIQAMGQSMNGDLTGPPREADPTDEDSGAF